MKSKSKSVVNTLLSMVIGIVVGLAIAYSYDLHQEKQAADYVVHFLQQMQGKSIANQASGVADAAQQEEIELLKNTFARHHLNLADASFSKINCDVAFSSQMFQGVYKKSDCTAVLQLASEQRNIFFRLHLRKNWQIVKIGI